MPAKKTARKTTKKADVKVVIEHIVPTTQYGHVKYAAECTAANVKQVGELLAEIIGNLYPPYNPDKPVDDTAEKFNKEAAKVKADNDTKKEDLSTEDFDPAF